MEPVTPLDLLKAALGAVLFIVLLIIIYFGLLLTQV